MLRQLVCLCFLLETAETKPKKPVIACKRMRCRPGACVDMTKREVAAFCSSLMRRNSLKCPRLIRCYHGLEERGTFHNQMLLRDWNSGQHAPSRLQKEKSHVQISALWSGNISITRWRLLHCRLKHCRLGQWRPRDWPPHHHPVRCLK